MATRPSNGHRDVCPVGTTRTEGEEPLKLTGEEHFVQQQQRMDIARRAFLEAKADERKLWRCDFKFCPEEAVMFEDFVYEAFMFMTRRSG